MFFCEVWCFPTAVFGAFAVLMFVLWSFGCCVLFLVVWRCFFPISNVVLCCVVLFCVELCGVSFCFAMLSPIVFCSVFCVLSCLMCCVVLLCAVLRVLFCCVVLCWVV